MMEEEAQGEPQIQNSGISTLEKYNTLENSYPQEMVIEDDMAVEGDEAFSDIMEPIDLDKTYTTGINETSDYYKEMLGGDTIEVTPLGAGCEVGRSCVVVKYRNKSIMFDCGLHPAHSGVGSLPLFDAIAIEDIDLCLVTHFHLDHCGAVPYIVTKTSFKGRVIMTEPTKAICKLLWLDYARMGKIQEASAIKFTDDQNDSTCAEIKYDERPLFTIEDVYETLDRVETIGFHQTLNHRGIKVIAYNAGHVLGACMFMLELDNQKVLYTGDYSREIDRHVPKAEIPLSDVHLLICESTYGIKIHDDRKQREKRFLNSVTQIVHGKKGKCLLPVFALGRAQELLLMLEEHWNANPQLQHIPIYYISPLAYKSLNIFQSFVSVSGPHIKECAMQGRNPFDFKFVKNIRNTAPAQAAISQDGPCVVMAAPGMLQSGVSRELFEAWAPNARNGVILTGYAVKGTLADDLKREPETIQLADRVLKRACNFEVIPFSAHADFQQTQQFIEELRVPNVVLVHGERTEMNRLKQKLTTERPSLAVFAPEILQTVCLRFPTQHSVSVVGSLAQQIKDSSQRQDEHTDVNAVIIFDSNWEKPKIMSIEDTNEYTDLRPGTLLQSLDIPYTLPPSPLIEIIKDMYEEVEPVDDGRIYLVCSRVNLNFLDGIVRLEWTAGPYADVVANSIGYLAIEIVQTPTPAQALLFMTRGEQNEELVRRTLLTFLSDTYEVLHEKAPVNDSSAKIDGENTFLKVDDDKVDILVRHPTNPQESLLVEVNFKFRSVMCKVPEVRDAVTSKLRMIEKSLLPLQAF